MKYTPKLPPEGINAEPNSLIKEFATLAFWIALAVSVLLACAYFLAGYLIRFIPLDTEHRWFEGVVPFETMVTKSPTDKQMQKYLQSLVLKLHAHGPKPNQLFEINIVDEPWPNAFVTPGGYIYLTTGLFKSVQSENGLAMVIAHEMGHQYARHPLKALGQGLILAATISMIMNIEGADVVGNVIGSTAELGQLRFSRGNEREADAIGVSLMKKAYGHACGGVEFFNYVKTYNADSANVLPNFLSTHPKVDERITKLSGACGDSESVELKPLPNFYNTFISQKRTAE